MAGLIIGPVMAVDELDRRAVEVRVLVLPDGRVNLAAWVADADGGTEVAELTFGRDAWAALAAAKEVTPHVNDDLHDDPS